MWARLATGAVALGLYGWRIEDPKGSYAAFYDVSNWLTGLLVSGEGLWHYVRNVANLILIDQADGFLLGMAFMGLVSVVLWPISASSVWLRRRLSQSVKLSKRTGRPEPS